jgi:hypothetical protein
MRAMCSLQPSVTLEQGTIRRVQKSIVETSVETPVTGLPEARKRPHAFGSPSIAEFHAAIARHRVSSTKSKTQNPRTKK